MSATFTPLY